MKPQRRHATRILGRLGCRAERMDPGVDAVCPEDGGWRRYIVRALNPLCTVNVSWLSAREARRRRSWLLIYDPETLEVVARLPPEEWYGMLQGYVERRIHCLPRGCVVRLASTPGLEGRRICLVVGRETYERVMERLRRAGDWDSLFELLP